MAVVKTPTVPNPGAIQVNTSRGEHLFFRVTAVGPVAIFAFANMRGTVQEPPDFPGHPTTVYEWVHFKNPSDIQHMDVLTTLFSFFTNAKYTYLVDLRDATGAKLRTVLETTHTGTPTDTSNEAFTVVVA
jgi:hypothetical protein